MVGYGRVWYCMVIKNGNFLIKKEPPGQRCPSETSVTQVEGMEQASKTKVFITLNRGGRQNGKSRETPMN